MIYNGKCVETVGASSQWQTTITPTKHYEIVYSIWASLMPVHYSVRAHNILFSHPSFVWRLADDARASSFILIGGLVYAVHCIDYGDSTLIYIDSRCVAYPAGPWIFLLLSSHVHLSPQSCTKIIFFIGNRAEKAVIGSFRFFAFPRNELQFFERCVVYRCWRWMLWRYQKIRIEQCSTLYDVYTHCARKIDKMRRAINNPKRKVISLFILRILSSPVDRWMMRKCILSFLWRIQYPHSA